MVDYTVSSREFLARNQRYCHWASLSSKSPTEKLRHCDTKEKNCSQTLWGVGFTEVCSHLLSVERSNLHRNTTPSCKVLLKETLRIRREPTIPERDKHPRLLVLGGPFPCMRPCAVQVVDHTHTFLGKVTRPHSPGPLQGKSCSIAKIQGATQHLHVFACQDGGTQKFSQQTKGFQLSAAKGVISSCP